MIWGEPYFRKPPHTHKVLLPSYRHVERERGGERSTILALVDLGAVTPKSDHGCRQNHIN